MHYISHKVECQRSALPKLTTQISSFSENESDDNSFPFGTCSVDQPGQPGSFHLLSRRQQRRTCSINLAERAGKMIKVVVFPKLGC